MLRQVIQIDSEKCTGCRLCADACHEGALGLRDGKAVLLRDDFCDGMGDCLPACPADAISFVEREALPYDESAVQAAKAAAVMTEADAEAPSQLGQWPCQIKLMPLQAPYYQGADILIAADCTAFANARLHDNYMRGRITLIGCPKLDGVDYSEKLSSIFALNSIASVTMCRMEVPCCGGLQRATELALAASGKQVPYEVVTFSTKGDVL